MERASAGVQGQFVSVHSGMPSPMTSRAAAISGSPVSWSLMAG